jgi:hypothetical protein
VRPGPGPQIVGNLKINGVEVRELVEAELDRRYPERAVMRPADAAGFRRAWEVIGRLWDGTVDRARRLDPDLLHESVDGEWSFIQTLRHLGLPWDDPDETRPLPPGIIRDRDARPSLETVLRCGGTGWQ